MNIQPFYPAPAIPLRIAVVGSGISGSAAAMALSRHHEVTIYEKNPVPGGHTATVDIDYDGKAISVDTGFIVYNEATYPKLTRLFDELDVKTHESSMSFALSLDHGALEWSGVSLATLFAQKSNLVRPSFWKMLAEILRFNTICLRDRDKGRMRGMSIGEYLEWRGFSVSFTQNYLIPMAAAIWSAPAGKMLEFPAARFIHFFENHRLINLKPHPWRTVTGGSRNYLDRMLKPLGDRVRTSCGVKSVSRRAGAVFVTDEHDNCERYDRLVLACHSDQALAMLSDATIEEKHLLSAVGWQPNRVVLHRDPALMPVRRKVWAAWNYLKSSNQGQSGVTLTYWMNRLQGIDDDCPLFVTLNPDREPDPDLIFGEFSYDHPQFDAGSFDAQEELQRIQGMNNTWYAGAWTGYGFHEDGLSSGLAAAEQILQTCDLGKNRILYREAAE